MAFEIMALEIASPSKLSKKFEGLNEKKSRKSFILYHKDNCQEERF